MNGSIEDIIESKIEKIANKNNIYHSGKVSRINSFVIEATGLEDAFFFEMVYVGSEENIGYVDKIEENKTIIAIVKTNNQIKIGDVIKTTGQALQSGFSKEAMGMVVDAFGTDRFSNKNFKERKMIAIETPKIPIMDRTTVNRPLETGIAGIDMMFPIGKGQRQLIIGDKKTGKTQILLDTIVNQKDKDVICLYVSIGKTKKDIKRIFTKLVEKGANEYTQIIAAFNDDPSPLIKLTPYVALSVAEEYMREGRDVLVCIDDLKKHADACREIALIAEKNTGREAYPADIFYTHSRMLEKGCQYKNGGSITILPVVETKGGDITDYISTNIISITDGQIVLNEKTFKKGQKPAIDFGLSVSRLGGAVQKPNIKALGAKVRRELLSYLETADVYQLVKIDAMSPELQEKMILGQKILSLLKQQKYTPRSEEQLINLFSFIEQSEPLTIEENTVEEPTEASTEPETTVTKKRSRKKKEKITEPNNETEIPTEVQTEIETTPIIEVPTEVQTEVETTPIIEVPTEIEINEYEERGNTEILDVTFDDEKSNEEITIPEIKPINEDNDELENTKILDTVYENEEKGNTEVLDVVYDDKLPTEIIEENDSTTEKIEEPVIEQVIESNVEMPVYEFATENQLETSIIQNVEIPTVEQINIEPVQESIYERLGNTEIIEVPTVERQEDNIKEEPVIISSEPIIIATTAVPEKISGEEE